MLAIIKMLSYGKLWGWGAQLQMLEVEYRNNKIKLKVIISGTELMFPRK